MARKIGLFVVGGITLAAAAAVISVVVLRANDEEAEKAAELEAVAASHAAELEREHQRKLAEEKAKLAEEAALAAAEKTRLAVEEEKARQEARAKAIEEARTAGVLGTLSAQEGGAFASITGTGDFSSGFDNADIVGGLVGNEAAEAAGGFGFGGSGSGLGGAGTGAGTIGLGSYGTLGSGTGQGYGVGGGRGGLRGRTTSAPTVRLGVSQVNGELDTNIVRRILRRQQARVTYCYEKQLLVEPGLSGTVTARFEIDERGAVIDASASGMNDEVASCVASALRSASFPAPKSGTVSVTASFAMSLPAP